MKFEVNSCLKIYVENKVNMRPGKCWQIKKRLKITFYLSNAKNLAPYLSANFANL